MKPADQLASAYQEFVESEAALGVIGAADSHRAAVLSVIAAELLRVLDLPGEVLAASRLKNLGTGIALPQSLIDGALLFARLHTSPGDSPALSLEAAHRLGEAFDLLIAQEVGGERRKRGSYFTPVTVAKALIARALGEGDWSDCESICDPACGGGAFLLEAAAQLAHKRAGGDSAGSDSLMHARRAVAAGVHGGDVSELAVATTELALYLFSRDAQAELPGSARFVVGDALVGPASQFSSEKENGSIPGTDLKAAEALLLELKSEGFQLLNWQESFPNVFKKERGGFDWIVGNPPWVAFQGRATQKISAPQRAYYRARYLAFRGYPTLHGLFVERATELASSGSLTLLLPSSLSDLKGYENARRQVSRAHSLREPLIEFGQDAFEGVVQPCFGLIARARPATERRRFAPEKEAARPWKLEERARAAGVAQSVHAPCCLNRLSEGPLLPAAVFKEMGFQSNRLVSSSLFLRADEPEGQFNLPLLEGRNVSEFEQRRPRLFLALDQEVLSEAKCRLRDRADYEKVDFVVRQTASFTIAARHGDLHFRNSLIGGFSTEELSTDLLVGLLNSALFRAIHISRQRDARQAAFPQVKLAHLRSLPLPPSEPERWQRIEALSQKASQSGGLDLEMRDTLDREVEALFALSPEESTEMHAYLADSFPAARAVKAPK